MSSSERILLPNSSSTNGKRGTILSSLIRYVSTKRRMAYLFVIIVILMIWMMIRLTIQFEYATNQNSHHQNHHHHHHQNHHHDNHLDIPIEVWKTKEEKMMNKDIHNLHDIHTIVQQRQQEQQNSIPIQQSSRNNNNNNNNDRRVIEFERQEGVVIVTKIHGKNSLVTLKQFLCLITSAYNYQLHYDIVVFTTEPIIDDDSTSGTNITKEFENIVKPAKLSFVVDFVGGIQHQISLLTPYQRNIFFQRCNVTTAEELTIWSTCKEINVTKDKYVRLSYNWQAQFRTLHIWNHPALAPYRYMLWIDADGYPSRIWHRDPVAFFIQNKLVLLADHFPKGAAKGTDIQERIYTSFNKTLCNLTIQNGHFVSEIASDQSCIGSKFELVHGFFHITDMDFYRTDVVMGWVQNLIGDCFLCRKYDDQIAITVPPAILAPSRAWDMRRNGIRLNIYHNGKWDGKEKAGGFKKYWERNASDLFPEAYDKCTITVNG